jgi:hypothetical protein
LANFFCFQRTLGSGSVWTQKAGSGSAQSQCGSETLAGTIEGIRGTDSIDGTRESTVFDSKSDLEPEHLKKIYLDTKKNFPKKSLFGTYAVLALFKVCS